MFKFFAVLVLALNLVFGVVATAWATSWSEAVNNHPAVMGKMIYAGALPAKFSAKKVKDLCLTFARSPVIQKMCGKSSGKFIKGPCGVTQGSDSKGKYVLMRYQQYFPEDNSVSFCGKRISLDSVK